MIGISQKIDKLINLDDDELLKAAGVPYKKIDKDNNDFFRWLVRSEVMTFICHIQDRDYISEDRDIIIVYNKILKSLAKHMEQSINYGWKCPKEGEFYGYKAVMLDRGRRKSKFEFGIAKLRIPKEAKRVSPFLGGRKCRCDLAFVEEIRRVEVVRDKPVAMTGTYTINYKTSEDGTILKADRGLAIYNNTFEYVTGEFVRPYLPFDDNPWIECSSGIHFFVDEQDALRFGEQNLMI